MLSSARKRFTATLGRARYSIKERLGIAAYTREATYQISGTVTLAHTEDRTIRGRIVIPIPQSADHQTFVEPILWAGSDVVIARDTRFGNEYAYADFLLAAHASVAWSFSCVVRVFPRRASLSNTDTLARYAGVRSDACASQDKKVKALAALLRGSEVRCGPILQKFNEQVIRSLQYGSPQRGLYSASDALSLPEVDCGGFCSLFCALCAAAGMPGRIVSGFWPGRNPDTAMHAWCEICLPDGTWVPADPSIEYLVRQGRDRTKSGRLGYVGSDRVFFSMGSSIPIEQEDGVVTTVDLLQHPKVFVREGAVPQLSFDLSIEKI